MKASGCIGHLILSHTEDNKTVADSLCSVSVYSKCSWRLIKISIFQHSGFVVEFQDLDHLHLRNSPSPSRPVPARVHKTSGWSVKGDDGTECLNWEIVDSVDRVTPYVLAQLCKTDKAYAGWRLVRLLNLTDADKVLEFLFTLVLRPCLWRWLLQNC